MSDKGSEGYRARHAGKEATVGEGHIARHKGVAAEAPKEADKAPEGDAPTE